jgi:hypothetical protein
MSVKFRNGQPQSESALKAFEEQIGVMLPHDFREFTRLHNGAEPETNIFSAGKGNESCVNRFIPLEKILSERTHIDQERLRFLPVAWAEGGNYVCLDLDNGGIFFWDHEEPSDELKLAESFRHFIEMLAPFDVKDVTLKPGQVKKAWIDPDFLKGLG